MIEIGKINKLEVCKIVDFGLYLNGEEWDEILLPNETMPEGIAVGDFIDVFLYFDSEDRIIATTSTPTIQVGEFAFMKCNGTANFGAFMDWGLRKDLLIPLREQQKSIHEGDEVLVYAYEDRESDRIVGSTKVNKFLDQTLPEYKKGDKVELLIVRESAMGVNVIINNAHWGLIHVADLFVDLYPGDKIVGYIKQVREDEKIDVVLQPLGYNKVEPLAEQILELLRANGGQIALGDKSKPEEIASMFGCSKKSFKQATGSLYKQKLITINEFTIILD